jgi:hypothetical protein
MTNYVIYIYKQSVIIRFRNMIASIEFCLRKVWKVLIDYENYQFFAFFHSKRMNDFEEKRVGRSLQYWKKFSDIIWFQDWKKIIFIYFLLNKNFKLQDFSYPPYCFIESTFRVFSSIRKEAQTDQ